MDTTTHSSQLTANNDTLRRSTLAAFGRIMAFLFLSELAIMFILDALGFLDWISHGGIIENILDALLLILISAPYIWFILRRQELATLRQKDAEGSLFLLQKAFEHTAEAFVVTDASANILNVNPAFTLVTGYAREEVIGKNPKLLRSGRHDNAFYQEMWHSILEHGQWQGEIWNRRKNGDIYPEWLTITAIRDSRSQVTHYISVFTDMTAHKRLEESLHRVTYFDTLTGLPNREMLHERMAAAFARAERENTLVALIFFDLDRFKHINETLGHKLGDELLQLVAQRLTALGREDYSVCRLGGDEFIILLEAVENADAIAELAKEILASITVPFSVHNHELHVTTSLGISVYPTDGVDRTTLMKNADAALYRAMANGGNSYQFYRESMNAGAFNRLTLEGSLRHAVKRNELRLYYQPQVSTHSGHIEGMEALVRWHHPELGLVSPGVFIPLAEENGMIIEIGEWVLRTACLQAKAWADAGYPLRVGVNVSARQFHQENIEQRIIAIIDESGLDPHQLEIEITESLIMSNPTETCALLERLRELGIQIAIDDFGTGYSSLSHLKHFPIDTLKVDQSFIREVSAAGSSAAIAATIVSLAHALGMKSIAEGVETMEQLAFMRTHNCHEIQGFLFSRPVPAEDFEKLLACDMVIKPQSSEAVQFPLPLS